MTSHSAEMNLVSELERSGVDFAFIHDEEAFVKGRSTSDIDILVDRPPNQVAAMLSHQCPELLLAVDANYEPGALASIWIDPQRNGIVRLDMLHDPQGKGRLGVRTGALLDRRIPGLRYPRLSPSDELTCRILKRWVTADSRLSDTISLAGSAGSQNLTSEGPLTHRAIRDLASALSGQRIPTTTLRMRRSRAVLQRWAWDRLRNPQGFVIGFEGSNVERAESAALWKARLQSNFNLSVAVFDANDLSSSWRTAHTRRKLGVCLDVSLSGRVHARLPRGSNPGDLQQLVQYSEGRIPR